MKSQQAAFKELLDKNGFDIGSRQYRFAKMPFKMGKKIFAYLTAVASQLDAGNFSFLDTDKFENDIEPILFDYLLVDGFKLSTLENHFDEFPSDYMQAVVAAIQGFSAPFLPESPTGSASTAQKEVTTTYKKQM